ncbi:MAG: hypothetical protein JW747_00615 [Candidatus Aminicenantes bacterium]|nr:hypothetical protein [Candidatus Aminicenantes bacterium]
MPKRKTTIFFDNRDSQKALKVEAWLKKWKDEVTVLSANYGCGCHHDLYDVEGPEEALAELPASVLAAVSRGRNGDPETS